MNQLYHQRIALSSASVLFFFCFFHDRSLFDCFSHTVNNSEFTMVFHFSVVATSLVCVPKLNTFSWEWNLDCSPSAEYTYLDVYLNNYDTQWTLVECSAYTFCVFYIFSLWIELTYTIPQLAMESYLLQGWSREIY